MSLKEGMRFSSFQEFENILNLYRKEKYVDFSVTDAATLDRAKKKFLSDRFQHAPFVLKYHTVKYRCVNGGIYKKRKTCSFLRNTPSMKMNCPALIYLRLSHDGKSLVIEKLVEEHNHEVSPELFKNLPKQRKLDPEVEKEVINLLELKADKKLIQKKYSALTQKKITMRHLHNLAAKGRSSKDKHHPNYVPSIFSCQQPTKRTVLLSGSNPKSKAQTTPVSSAAETTPVSSPAQTTPVSSTAQATFSHQPVLYLVQDDNSKHKSHVLKPAQTTFSLQPGRSPKDKHHPDYVPSIFSCQQPTKRMVLLLGSKPKSHAQTTPVSSTAQATPVSSTAQTTFSHQPGRSPKDKHHPDPSILSCQQPTKRTVLLLGSKPKSHAQTTPVSSTAQATPISSTAQTTFSHQPVLYLIQDDNSKQKSHVIKPAQTTFSHQPDTSNQDRQDASTMTDLTSSEIDKMREFIEAHKELLRKYNLELNKEQENTPGKARWVVFLKNNEQ